MDPDLSLKLGTTIIAIAALFRPEIEKAIRRRASKLDFELIGFPEIGYAAFGPTIGLIGTLTGLNSAQYISKITCNVRRRQDKAEFTLPWLLFRPPEAAVTEGNISNDTTIQVASPFFIAVDESVTKNIIFQDQDTFSIVKGKLLRLIDEWTTFKNSKIRDPNFLEIANQINSKTPGTDINIAVLLLAYEEYKKTTEYQDAKRIFQDYLYWKPGKFDVSVTITIRVPGSNKTKRYEKSFSVELADEDLKKLMDNFEIISGKAILKIEGNFNFVYPRLIDVGRA